MNFFEDLLKELSPLIGLGLHPDRHGACCLLVGDRFKVQIEPDKNDDILIFALLHELPPGKFREEVLKEALKANAQFIPGGVIGFCEKANHLAIYDKLPHHSVNVHKLLNALNVLIDYSTQWQQALLEGKTAPSFIASKSYAPPPPFGIKL